MAVQSAADAGFFALVHEVLEAEKKRGNQDRRDQNRRVFECTQLIAPYQNGRLPAASEFRHVRCQDLSPGGMSYYDEQLPEHPQLLVMLGSAPFIFLTAEVVRHAPVTSGDRAEHLIGCRFTGRLKH